MFQILDNVNGSHPPDVPTLHPVHCFLHPDAGLHDVQRLPLPGARARPHLGVFLFRVEKAIRRRPHRTLSVN